MSVRSERTDRVFLTEAVLEAYLQDLAEQGVTPGTVHTYRSALRHLYRDLPPSKELTADTAEKWKAELERRGYSGRTVNDRVYALNKLLRYLGKEGWQLQKKKAKPPPEPPDQMDRAEYHLLLQMAKRMGRRRSYLLIKTMVNAGLKTQELPQLTVEALGRGEAVTTRHGLRRRVPIPEPLCGELRAYAAAEGIGSGPVFVTKDGTPMVHSAVWKEVKLVCRNTGLPEEKGTPRGLHRLYQTTYRGFCTTSIERSEELYQGLLKEEERIVAWSA